MAKIFGQATPLFSARLLERGQLCWKQLQQLAHQQMGSGLGQMLLCMIQTLQLREGLQMYFQTAIVICVFGMCNKMSLIALVGVEAQMQKFVR
jgi:hypothetical protein